MHDHLDVTQPVRRQLIIMYESDNWKMCLKHAVRLCFNVHMDVTNIKVEGLRSLVSPDTSK